METDTYMGDSGRLSATHNFTCLTLPGFRSGYQIAGCCGACQVYNMEDFNNPTKMDWTLDDPYTPVKNKGFLLYLNPEKPEDIQEVDTSIVEKIQLGEDTLYLRIKVDTDD